MLRRYSALAPDCSHFDCFGLVFKAFFISFEVWTFLKLFIISPSSLCNLCRLSLLPSSVILPDYLFSLRLSLSQLPLRFNDNLVLRQLRYTGMLETVRIRQSGYNIKYSFKVTHIYGNSLNILVQIFCHLYHFIFNTVNNERRNKQAIWDKQVQYMC